MKALINLTKVATKFDIQIMEEFLVKRNIAYFGFDLTLCQV